MKKSTGAGLPLKVDDSVVSQNITIENGKITYKFATAHKEDQQTTTRISSPCCPIPVRTRKIFDDVQ